MCTPSEFAFEASEDNDPIIISAVRARRMIDKHGIDADTFFAENPGLADNIDAATVFAWLGY